MNKVFNKLIILNPSRLFEAVFGKRKISKQAALKIQKASYGARKSCKRNNYDKPYMEIVSFLETKEYEVFCSAVMNLVNIANNNHEDSKKIRDILQKKSEDKNLLPEQKKYLTNQISKISL